jgi:hypothetical protein
MNRTQISLGSLASRPIIFVVILLGAITLDSLLSNISDLLGEQLAEGIRILIFSALVICVVISGRYLIAYYSRIIRMELGLMRRDLDLISKVSNIVQIILSIVLVLILLQIILTLQYYTVLLSLVMITGYLLGSLMLGLLSYKFFLWYKSKRNTLILLYVLSSAALSVTSATTIVAQTTIVFNHYPIVVEHVSPARFPSVNVDIEGFAATLLEISYLIGFGAVLLTWGSTMLMLHNYSSQIGKIRYWFVILPPLVSLFIGLVPIMLAAPTTQSYLDAQLFIFRIISISALISQGFLYGFAFLTVSQSIRTKIKSIVSDYLKISALGITILLISLSANMAAGVFPPFGILSYSAFFLGAYFFLTGIYSSAISISIDSRLRDLIRKSVADQSKLIDSIGIANLSEDLQKRIISIAKDHGKEMATETGIPSTMSESDMNDYLRKVLEEIGTTRPTTTKGTKNLGKDHNENSNTN